MRILVLLVVMLLPAPAASVAQQAKVPKGCIPCEALCDWCISLGKQDATGRAKCHQGCRSWGSMVGLGTVYVHKNQSLCGKGNYAPRCN
jgi:hypothetical protein